MTNQSVMGQGKRKHEDDDTSNDEYGKKAVQGKRACKKFKSIKDNGQTKLSDKFKTVTSNDNGNKNAIDSQAGKVRNSRYKIPEPEKIVTRSVKAKTKPSESKDSNTKIKMSKVLGKTKSKDNSNGTK